MKKSFVLLLLTAQSVNLALAQNPQKDASIYVTALKEDKIDENILQSEAFADCKQKISENLDITTTAGKDEIRNCLQDKFANVEDEEIEKFSKSLALDSVGFKETQNAGDLREYLNKRIFNAIHGKDAYEKKKIKELKFVDQGVFLELYKTQISKNLILEVSRYCLENLGRKDEPGHLIVGANVEANKGQERMFDKEFEAMISDNPGTAQITISSMKFSEERTENGKKVWKPTDLSSVSPQSLSGFFADIEEFKYCPNLSSDPSDPCHEKRARNAEQLKVLKDQELAWGKTDTTGATSHLSGKYMFCSNFMIKNMCELYRCNNVYDNTSKSLLYEDVPAQKVCSILGAGTLSAPSTTGSISLESGSDKRGQIACNVLERVETYRKTFAAIEEVEKKNKDLKGSGVGVNVDRMFKGGIYDQKNLDDITTISSKELVENVDSFGKSQEDIKALEERCFDGVNFNANDEECMALAGDINGADLAKIQLDTEAETAAYLERLKKLEQTDNKDELKEYLIKHGLHDYLEMYDQLPPAEVVKLISDKYKADRKALINNMNERFHKLKKKKAPDAAGGSSDPADAANIAAVAKDQVEEIKQQKDRLETLYNYSNIVSSYLSVKDEDGNETQNSRARQIEIEGLQEHDAQAAEAYQEYFSEGEDSGSEGTISAQGQFIDNILGIGAKD